MNETRERLGVVACGIFKDELEEVWRRNGLNIPLFYLAPAPCIAYQVLERQLTRLLERTSKLCDEVLVVIGQCHPSINEIMSHFPARRLPMDNCFDALLGGRSREYTKDTNTFFTTPAWLKHWRRAFRRGFGWSEEDVRQNFGLYERILVLDAGVTSYSDEQILELFDYTQVPVEFLKIDLSDFADLLVQNLGLRSPAT